jgi:hypothetical protein
MRISMRRDRNWNHSRAKVNYSVQSTHSCRLYTALLTNVIHTLYIFRKPRGILPGQMDIVGTRREVFAYSDFRGQWYHDS